MRALLLFLATCLTTTWAGASYSQQPLEGVGLGSWLRFLAGGLPFSISLLSILSMHEMGHYVAARVHGVRVSLPYFLPLPFGMIGTLGAVIRMPQPVEDRNALLDIAAAGPLVGLIIAVGVLCLGLHLSPVGPSVPGMLEGNSLLYLLLKRLIKGSWLPGNGQDVLLHAVAWAGWVGLLVTMINLIPIGQLDGGHIAHAYFGNRHNIASRWLHRALLPMALIASGYAIWELRQQVTLDHAIERGVWAGLSWFVWWGMLYFFRPRSSKDYHPPVNDTPLSRGRKRLCAVVLVIFVLIFMPIPLRWTFG